MPVQNMSQKARGIALLLASLAGVGIIYETIRSNHDAKIPATVIQELRIAKDGEQYKVVPDYGSAVYAFMEKNKNGTESRAMAPALEDFANVGDEMIVRKPNHTLTVKVRVGDIDVPYYPNARASKN